MREGFDEGRHFERHRTHCHDLKRAVFVIRLEDAIGGKKNCQQQDDPQEARCDPAQRLLIGTKADRQEHDHGEKEAECGAGTAALAQSKAQIALEQARKRLHDC